MTASELSKEQRLSIARASSEGKESTEQICDRFGITEAELAQINQETQGNLSGADKAFEDATTIQDISNKDLEAVRREATGGANLFKFGNGNKNSKDRQLTDDELAMEETQTIDGISTSDLEEIRKAGAKRDFGDMTTLQDLSPSQMEEIRQQAMKGNNSKEKNIPDSNFEDATTIQDVTPSQMEEIRQQVMTGNNFEEDTIVESMETVIEKPPLKPPSPNRAEEETIIEEMETTIEPIPENEES